MHKYLHEYGPVPRDYEDQAREIFPYKSISAEQYAAYESHKWGTFSFDNYIYNDAELNEWIHSLGDIFFTKCAVETARMKYLTSDELTNIRLEERDHY